MEQFNGIPIQPLYNGHEQTYADYSHGIRLVQRVVILDSAAVMIDDILELFISGHCCLERTDSLDGVQFSRTARLNSS